MEGPRPNIIIWGSCFSLYAWGQVTQMMSISHWGMFDYQPVILTIPAGFKVSEKDLAEWRKPGQIFIVDRSQIEGQPWEQS